MFDLVLKLLFIRIICLFKRAFKIFEFLTESNDF